MVRFILIMKFNVEANVNQPDPYVTTWVNITIFVGWKRQIDKYRCIKNMWLEIHKKLGSLVWDKEGGWGMDFSWTCGVLFL